MAMERPAKDLAPRRRGRAPPARPWGGLRPKTQCSPRSPKDGGEVGGRGKNLDVISVICVWIYMAVVVKTVLGYHFGGFGEFTTHFRTYFSGDWDVHRGGTGF